MCIRDSNDLVKAIEEKFGVSAAAMAAPAAGGGGAAAAAVEEKTEFNVVLLEAGANKVQVIKAGALNGKALDADGVKALAAVPSKEVLLTQIAGLLQSPIARFARAIGAVAAKKGGGAEEAAAEAPAAEADAAPAAA